MPRVSRPPRPRVTPRVQDRPNRWRVMWRRQRKMLAPLAGMFAVLVLLAGAASALRAVAAGPGLRDRIGSLTAGLGLRVRTIDIQGRVKTPQALLNAALGVVPGEPLLTYSVEAARARVESINWVAAATIERRLPDTIVVRLQERRPFAVWQHDGKFHLIDRDGQVVTDSNVAAFAKELPLVVGLGAPQEAAALEDALAAQPTIAARVAAAVRVGSRRWNLRLNNGIDVLLPEGAEPQALARLVQLQKEHAILDRPLQAIDLRLPDRFVFRPQPAAIPGAAAKEPQRRPT
jgi:cell division protein FtsQ